MPKRSKKDTQGQLSPAQKLDEANGQHCQEPLAVLVDAAATNRTESEQKVLSEEERRQRIYKVAALLEETKRYASTPAVQRKLRELYGEGMHQQFVNDELAARRLNFKLESADKNDAEAVEPLMTEIRRGFEYPFSAIANAIKNARAQERYNAEGSITKIQQEARHEISRIELELGDYMEDNERLIVENARLIAEVTNLKGNLARNEALLALPPKVPDAVEEKLAAIMAAISAKELAAQEKSESKGTPDNSTSVVSVRSRKVVSPPAALAAMLPSRFISTVTGPVSHTTAGLAVPLGH